MSKFNPDDFKMGYFILYRNDGSKFGNLIERKQRQSGFLPDHAQYTHVEVSGGSYHSTNISPPLSKLIEINKVHKGRYVRLVKFKGAGYDTKRYKVAYFSASLCNRGYDFSGVLSFIFRWIKQNNRLYFCSEGALWSLEKVYQHPLGYTIDPSNCMPAHFCLPEYFDYIWEGTIE